MSYQSFRSYQLPRNPVVRVLLFVAGAALLALSFFIGVALFAVLAGLAVLAAAYLAILRLVYRLRGGRAKSADDPLEVEYRVVRRERHDDPP